MARTDLTGPIYVVQHVTSVNIPNMRARPIIAFTNIREANRINDILNSDNRNKATFEIEQISCFAELSPQMLAKLKNDHVF